MKSLIDEVRRSLLNLLRTEAYIVNKQIDRGQHIGAMQITCNHWRTKSKLRGAIEMKKTWFYDLRKNLIGM